MKLWKTWIAVFLIGASVFLSPPVHISAIDNAERTSIPQPAALSATPTIINQPLSNSRSAASLADSVLSWKTTLSQEPGFETWKQASWQSYPLGPGMHGWVVILKDHGIEVGSMIVGAAEDGSLRLMEYGTGDSPLFSLTTLYRSLVQQALIHTDLSFEVFSQEKEIVKDRLYMDALTAVWKIQIQGRFYYFDAKSGELLPLKQDPTPRLADSRTASTILTGRVDSLLLPAFDPYDRMPWIQGTPLPVTNFTELSAALQQHGKLTYVTELYDRQVTLPLAVIGYKQWGSGDPYLAVDHEGARYVLMKEALAQGSIYTSEF